MHVSDTTTASAAATECAGSRKEWLILAINPGSTSTKVAVYRNETPVFVHCIKHTMEELAPYTDILEQHAFRKQLVLDLLERHGLPFRFDAIIGRGGLAKPIAGGVYDVNEAMLNDVRHSPHRHACNLGCLLADELAAALPGCRALTADPVVVDELEPEARICGLPEISRSSIWHALNQRAIARRYAREQGGRYEDYNLIICHLGGGISIASHRKGRAVSTYNALDGEGPFSPERAGSLPVGELIHLCYSGRYTERELLRRVSGNSGLSAYLGTKDMQEVLRRIEQGDEQARLLTDAMLFHVAKGIAAESAVLYGQIDAILITGGLAWSDYLIDRLKPRIEFLAPIFVYPGEDEMEAMADNALAVLRGDVQTQIYA